jgi:hypothetical protein
VVAVSLAVVAVGPAAAEHTGNHQAELTDDYIAGSAHAHAADQHHAVGPTDCSGLEAAPTGTTGGACFDLSAFEQGSDLFLRAEDDHSPTEVSLFAGFDLDGDGCVGCSPGEDAAWTGTGSLGADLVEPSEPLVVFVRAASLHGEDLHLATTGTLTLDVLDDDTSGCEGDSFDREGECGQPFSSDLPYPYPCIPDCQR